MEVAQLVEMLVAMGCPREKCQEMAVQLDKRARQLSAEKGSTYEQSLGRLLGLMKQGWAARERGF